ncbi:MAG: BatA domain-containing protein [Opitutaceae bacterium]
MMPVFANPAGLWALLCVPLVLGIHFLQQRSRVVRTSTWFLVEEQPPDSKWGRTWEQLRTSRQLWLQLATVVVATWVLALPRWVRSESAQTVVVVLDASASMEAFRAEAIAAARREMDTLAPLARRTTWIVMTSDQRQPALYRGPDRLTANRALNDWVPSLGEHETTPALRLARRLTGSSGFSIFLTDAKRKSFEGQRTIGVGRPIANVGFSGTGVTREGADTTWRALVRNYTDQPQRRTWRVETAAGSTDEQTFELLPGAMRELSGKMPGTDEMTVVLSDDGFLLDNRLPLVRPVPKPLSVRVEGDDQAAAFFRRVAADVEGVRLATGGAAALVRIAVLDATAAAQERQAGVFRPPSPGPAGATGLNSEPVTAEHATLVSDVSWQGWLGTGPTGYRLADGDTPLLWQGHAPLAFLRAAPAGGNKLMLAFDWDASNAARMPAMVLLLRRYLEEQRDNQAVFYAADFDCGDRVPLRLLTDSVEPYVLTTRLAGGPTVKQTMTATELLGLRAPARPAFFALARGEAQLVRGAAQFGDPRQGDFRQAETFRIEPTDEIKAALKRNSRPDPLARLWLAVVAALVIGTWWPGRLRVSTTKPPVAA